MKRAHLVLVLSVALGSSCVKFDVIRGDGNVVSEDRSVPAFTAVAILAPFDVDIALADERTVLLEAEQNLLGRVDVRVDDGVLVISEDDPTVELIPTSTMRATIGVESLTRVIASNAGEVTLDATGVSVLHLEHGGSGKLVVTGVELDDMDVDASGSGETVLDGAALRLAATSSGSGALSAETLAAGRVEIHTSGSGGANVRAAESVDGSLSGSGDLVIHGTASTIDVEDSGSGSVRIVRD